MQKNAHPGAKRSERVSDAIHRELAHLLRAEVRDPRLREMTLTQVEVTPDLSHAKIFLSHVTGRAVWPHAERALAKASGFLRSQLAGKLNTYSVPQLHFHYDDSLSQGMNVSALIERALDEDRQHPQE